MGYAAMHWLGRTGSVGQLEPLARHCARTGEIDDPQALDNAAHGGFKPCLPISLCSARQWR